MARAEVDESDPEYRELMEELDRLHEAGHVRMSAEESAALLKDRANAKDIKDAGGPLALLRAWVQTGLENEAAGVRRPDGDARIAEEADAAEEGLEGSPAAHGLSRAELRKARDDFIAAERRKAEEEGRPFPPAEAFKRGASSTTWVRWRDGRNAARERGVGVVPEWDDHDGLGFERFVIWWDDRPSDRTLFPLDPTKPFGPGSVMPVYHDDPAPWLDKLVERDPSNTLREAREQGWFKRDRDHNYLYRRWQDINDRCNNPNNKDHADYWGRNIRVRGDWDESNSAGPENFIAWILLNLGHKPSDEYSLDRIDNEGDYRPGNVRWATKAQQTANRRPRGRTEEDPAPRLRREAERNEAALAAQELLEKDIAPWFDENDQMRRGSTRPLVEQPSLGQPEVPDARHEQTSPPSSTRVHSGQSDLKDEGNSGAGSSPSSSTKE